MDIVLNQSSEIPIYTQIYNQISGQIINGVLTPGLKLPGIRQVANDLRISVIPVKMAWEQLDKEGFITTITGSGTFVKEIPAHEISSKINDIAQEIANKACIQAKEQGISKEMLIDYINKVY